MLIFNSQVRICVWNLCLLSPNVTSCDVTPFGRMAMLTYSAPATTDHNSDHSDNKWCYPTILPGRSGRLTTERFKTVRRFRTRTAAAACRDNWCSARYRLSSSRTSPYTDFCFVVTCGLLAVFHCYRLCVNDIQRPRCALIVFYVLVFIFSLLKSFYTDLTFCGVSTVTVSTKSMYSFELTHFRLVMNTTRLMAMERIFECFAVVCGWNCYPSVKIPYPAGLPPVDRFQLATKRTNVFPLFLLHCVD